ncbi:hypothetical protein [Cryobacterium zhongshanensis]|uniref:Uncharacterized protein n=1 Tax=Cryobacterium zhongshanensis TaxID=2928153 RepID=A0AA41QY54_9MICO|nr:hypothetical protein [Cryobacterium zhongshanensis]MCI4659687.1 hypothetical protein [Cryobacterium zhongshanensis]
MKISATFYNEDGELMAPRPLDVTLGSVTPGGIPSIEEGFYHRFKFEGRTEAEYLDKYRRFFANMAQVQGFSTLVLRPYTVEMGSFVRYGLDVLYAVEAVQAPSVAPVARPAYASRVQASTIIATR